MIAYLVDSTAGVVCGMAAVPAWVITADLHARFHATHAVGPLRADAVAVSPGRRQSLGQVRVVDEGDGDRLIASGTVNHLVIQPTADLAVPSDMPIGVMYGCLPVVGAAALRTHVGLRSPTPGSAELDVAGDAVNPLGILHGALITTLAVEAARSEVGRGEVVEVVVRFVKGVAIGPAVATVVSVDPGPDGSGAGRVGGGA